MYHTHFNSIHSTQLYLRDNLIELKSRDPEILISASEQTMGIGRRGSQWDFYDNSLAMSFTLRPNPVPTLTSIEMGLLFIKFINEEFGTPLFLKWPNDLLTSEGKKCGGILAQYIDQETVIGGIGVNLGSLGEVNNPLHYKHGLGNVSEEIKLSPDDKKNLPKKAYEFILKNRLSTTLEIQNYFSEVCIHLDKMVEIDDDDKIWSGQFKGIGKNGEALVDINGETKSFLSSSLKILA